MGEASGRFDRQLFTLKLSELSREMQPKAIAANRQAGAQSRGTRSVGLRMLDGQIAVLREWMEGMDRIGREVWQIQGEMLTPAFVREILLPEVLTLIAVRESTVKGQLARMAGRGAVQSSDLYPANHHLAMEINKIKGEIVERYEIEARTLAHRKISKGVSVHPEGFTGQRPQDVASGRPDAAKEVAKPKPRVPAPIRPVNTSGGIRLSPETSPSPAGGLKPLDYPHEFPPEARDRVEREKIRASRELLPASTYDFKDQEVAVRCIMWIFLTFAGELCAVRSEKGWTLERVQREAEEFLRRVTITIVFAKFPGCDRHWISNWNGSIESNMERRLKGSPEWAQYEELLMADIETKSTTSTSAAKTRSTSLMPGQFEGAPHGQVTQSKAETAGRLRANSNRAAKTVDLLLDAFGRSDTEVVSERTPAENSDKAVRVASKSTGRPRKDAERELVRDLKAKGESWKDIAAKVNAQTGQDKSAEAYRSLLKSPSGKGMSLTGENQQK